MPRVAMSSVTPSWLTRWRSTTRSITQASKNMKTTDTAKARMLESSLLSRPLQAGIHSAKRAMHSAATSTIAPCAKLSTPGALKISTKPRATSEYSMPAIRPPNRVSRKNAIFLFLLSVRGAEVSPDHVFVVAHFIGRAVADLLAVVQHHDAVRDVHHHAHVVLDQHDGGAEFVVHVEDEAAHVLLFFQVHAGHRLVQQQHLRLHGQRAPQIHPLLQTIGQLPHGGLAVGLDFQEVDDAFNKLALADFLALGRPDAQHLQQQDAEDLQIA